MAKTGIQLVVKGDPVKVVKEIRAASRRAHMKAIRKGLVDAERWHKRKWWISGSRAMRKRGERLRDRDTDPHRLTVRTGTLKRSYTRRIVEKELAGYYGSDLEYARIHEEGGRAGRGRKVTIRKRPGIEKTRQFINRKLEGLLAKKLKDEGL